MMGLAAFDTFARPWRIKGVLYLGLDGLLSPISLMMPYAFDEATWSADLRGQMPYIALVTVTGLVAAALLRLPSIRGPALETPAVLRIGGVGVVIALSAFALQCLSTIEIPSTIPLLAGMFFFMGALLGRSLDLFGLAARWRQEGTSHPICFADDNPILGRRREALCPLDPDVFLERDVVTLDPLEASNTYKGRIVLITGAGGSIGSELCRAILACRPAGLILLDHSEYNLYAIERGLDALQVGIPIAARLGSVADVALVWNILEEYAPEVVVHAAAYKHVPLVEENVLAGVQNNVIGTQVVAAAAARAGVERFIFVSTDKAICPRNVMGASKRLAEMVVQDLQRRHPGTCFAIVRFGNVLGSSGSVLPLFQKQIEAGGPVTVTHPEATRFFMTIPEAARLVLLAGIYAEGGDILVLDMGKPQRIIDIARRMIQRSGQSVWDPETGRGDIEIKITGLRPGEKLHEALLLEPGTLEPTPHPKILRAADPGLGELESARVLRDLQRALMDRSAARVKHILSVATSGSITDKKRAHKEPVSQFKG